jgi:hypothetical protein
MKIFPGTCFCLTGAILIETCSTSATAQATRSLIDDVTVTTLAGGALRIFDPNERRDSFNADMKRRGIVGKITGCKSLIDVPAGTAHGDHSYGGWCTIDESNEKVEVMICNDDMVGNFKVTKHAHSPTTQELVDFVVSNCVGG